jgi:hypothetical protein
MKNYVIAILILLIIFLFVIAILFLFFIGEIKVPYCGDNVCEEGEDYESCPNDCKREEIEQGAKGQITLYQGNCMPPIGPGCIVNNVSTTIKIYELIPKEEFNGTYYQGTEEPIATISSDQNGLFKIGLPNGQYSIFVEDPINKNLDYCNSFDINYSCPVTVDNNIVEFNIRIDHATW